MHYVPKNPPSVEAFTFEEFVEYAKSNSPHPHWSFDFHGIGVTYENDEKYLLPLKGPTVNVLEFTPDKVLIVYAEQALFLKPKDEFLNAYNLVKDKNSPLTDGEEFFAVDFNPGGRGDVDFIRRSCAAILDMMYLIIDKSELSAWHDYKKECEVFSQQKKQEREEFVAAMTEEELKAFELKEQSDNANQCSISPSEGVVKKLRGVGIIRENIKDAKNLLHLAQMKAVYCVTRVPEVK